MNRIFILTIAVLLGASTSNAQPGQYRQQSVEERVAAAHQKLDSAFKPEPAKLVKLDSVLATYYRNLEQVRKGLFSTGERPDMEAIREKMQPLADARDKELKAILTEGEFEIWKKDIEPALSPRRGGGQGRRS